MKKWKMQPSQPVFIRTLSKIPVNLASFPKRFSGLRVTSKDFSRPKHQRGNDLQKIKKISDRLQEIRRVYDRNF